jgi:hypothetical protein
MACTKSSHAGGCFCGAVRYRVDGPIDSVNHCHCNSCRRSSGAAFVTWFTVERERLAWTKGGVTQYPSSPGVARGFCGTCGTELTYASEQASKTIDVTIGSLDCADGHPADRHIWTADKLDWLHLDEHLPRHEGWSTEN